ncbi:hypothetical protein Sm713_69350 [Streptomyces sp. TS71-3]|nr:hypothetical protein Sm713_69350 [Streptomyces sp. TS71-3]
MVGEMAALAPSGQEGVASSNLQLSETLSVAVMTGLGTAVSAFAASQDWATNAGLGIVFVVTAAAALLGVGAGLRTGVRDVESGATADPQPADQAQTRTSPPVRGSEEA